MVSIGGQARPYVGDAIIQNISGKAEFNMNGTIVTSGHAATGVGGALVSGRICHSEAGFLPINVSGQQVWIAY